MFNLRKRVKKIENNQEKLENRLLTEDALYKFYLERKIDKINARLKYNLSYSIDNRIETIQAYRFRFFDDNNWKRCAKIKLSDIEIKKFNYILSLTRRDVYKEILKYINSKPISYFIKIDKKIKDLEKHNIELDKKKLNLEEELKKII